MPRDPTPADPDPQDRKALMFSYSLTQQGTKQRLRGVKGAPRDAVDSALQHGDGRYRWPWGVTATCVGSASGLPSGC